MRNRKQRKQIWKAAGAMLLSAVLALSAPASYLPAAMEVYAAETQADENGFVIENGVLTKYTGTAAEVVIPEGVTSIGSYAFSGCSGLTSIVIPSSVTSIGDHAFSDCSGLTSIEIPSSVTSIEDVTFWGCSGLTSIEIPSSVMSIGNWAFSGCSGLMSIEIPSSVTSIGTGTFSGCSGLTSIEIPSGVTSIGEDAFWRCSGLSSIVVAEGNTSYDSRENCNAIIEKSSQTLIFGCKNTVIPSSVTSIGRGAFQGCSGLTSIEIPSGITSIGESAFQGCSGLTSISIPSGLMSIGEGAFWDCSGLSSIVVAEGNTSYDSRENCNAIIEKSSQTLIFGCKNTVIPKSVTSIGIGAFAGSGLTGIIIPDNITSIGEGAFSDCSSLISVIIPSSVTSIEYGVFYGCSSLTSVTIPSSVTSIRAYAFNYCSSLRRITIPSSVTSIDAVAFSLWSMLITIYGEEGSYAQTYAEHMGMPFGLLLTQDVTLEQMTQFVTENQTQDVSFQTTGGIIITFKKGTMELTDGVDFYDFGAEITEDYSSLPNQNFAEEEFAFRIDYNYEGKLPGEAEIAIPADSKWAGKKLYYYEIKEDGTYSYVCRSTVEADGSYTVKQNHCSSYVATTKAPENLGDCDGEKGITSKDALAVLKFSLNIPQENFYPELADCDGEDGVTSKDALTILKYNLQIPIKFE